MNSIPMRNERFQQILQFYLLECPVRVYQKEKQKESAKEDTTQSKYIYKFTRVSKRGKSFRDRGLDGPVLNSLRAAMKRVAPGLIMQSTYASEDIKKIDAAEFIIVKRNEDRCSVTEGFFYFIRNSLAHGSFDVSDGYYYFENYKNGKLRGIARLKENTLIEWINLTDMTPEMLKRAGR